MDVVPSVSAAAGLYGFSSGHAFVHLAQMLQETCMKIHTATADNKVLLSVTICRPGTPGGMMLFGSGFVDGSGQERPSSEIEGAFTVAIDSMCSALCLLDEERGRDVSVLPGGSPSAVGSSAARSTPQGAAGAAAPGGVGAGGGVAAGGGIPVGSPGDIADSAEAAAGTGRVAAESRGGTASREASSAPAPGSSYGPGGIVAGDGGQGSGATDGDALASAVPQVSSATNNSPGQRLPGVVSQTLASQPQDALSTGLQAGGGVTAGNASGSDHADVGAAEGSTSVGGALRGSPGEGSATGSVAGTDVAMGGAAARTSLAGGASSVSAAASGRRTEQRLDYTLSHNFRLPGLTVAPPRTLLPCGRGRTRIPPPAPVMSTHFIPSQVVKETEAELKVPSRDNSFRNRLLEFIGLYKFVVDTLVKRKMTDATARAKVDHNYNQLTPEAARGATVRFKIRGSEVCFISPSFKNTRYMINDEYLAVIMLMKVRRDPFFLWLLALFSGGALAPTSAAASTTANRMSVAPTSRAANERMGRKRQRESPPKARVSSGAAGGSAGGGLGGGSGTGSGAAANGGLGGGSSGGTGGAARGASAGGVSGSSGDGYGRAIGGRGSGSLDERGRGGSDGGASGAANQGSDSNACGSTESNTQAGGVNAAVGGADGSSSADAGVSGSADRAGDFPVTAASQQPADAANALVKRVGASFLTVDGKRAATAELLLDLTMYHGVDIPPTVVTVFLQAIEHGSEDVVYPFGQDAQLCLVSGNPSPTPVTLGSIAAGYRSVWSVSSIGYVFVG